MFFSCPEEHFYKNIMLTLWNNFRLWAGKCRICGGTFAALLIKLLFCLQMGNWKNSFEGNFAFSEFFWTSREHFLVFSVYHSRHGGPNWIPPAKRNISIKKNFKRKFLSFPDYERNFLKFHWNISGMVVKTTAYVFRGALWERFPFFDNFSNVFCNFVRQSSRPLAKVFNSVVKTAFHVSKELIEFLCSSLSCFI